MLTILEGAELAASCATVNEFLCRLPGPVAIHVAGIDSDRTRALVTLSHGNEPSGLEAVYHWLRSGVVPAVNAVLVIASVEAARAEPLFYHRMLPGRRDLNRCFSGPADDAEGQLAHAILQHLRAQRPEAVIDLHNTSGSNPAFSVTTSDTQALRGLSSLFVNCMIMTDLRLGSLMEQDLGCPVVTIEAGGSQDESAEVVALLGLQRYLADDSDAGTVEQLRMMSHPLRLELAPHTRIDFSMHALHDRDVTVRSDIEIFNFKPVAAGQPLAWLGDAGMQHLQIGGTRSQNRVLDYFQVEQGQLCARLPMTLFMATTRPDIAAADCLFYFVAEESG